MNSARRPLVVPDLALPGVSLVAVSWLVAKGAHVHEGERVLEILAGDVLYDLSATVTGVLAARHVREDEPVAAGQVVGYIQAED